MNEAPGAPQSRGPACPAGQVKSCLAHHKRAVMMIELPFFPFCAMINTRTSLRACLYRWMMFGLVGRQIDRDFVKENAMNVIEAIHCRRSYKGKYKDIPVPKEDLIKIMQAGLDAPSGCNMQTTSLIAVDDPKILEKIHLVIEPPVGETAPAAICVLTQRINAYRDKCFAVQDYSAAIQNMLLAIVELGYQSCWYEGHITDDDKICDKMAQILNVPDSYELVCYLPVGIAESDSMQPKKKAFEERAWFNSFPQV